ncbi:MAG: hypothetical protein COT71_01205 [Candidatus Andersenbacteria bacterium CG10_big_fil_rev_8_21_14_0_10_54_11]|uniref:Uncharacterized protein n=1 Tax=Candidatus Andersenbacteria bacterium CG10_big_fil_rev_8_21_14_0_10_54_11 TaxID=1974485 RepID=A0A2M6X007_9BACT|nr:MAG: hypothetical protein COT71_01205 [Candidatus Andersenbacteria bacterium CG10_big_fil_rev_8_21_14_0_10_54_11]
MRMFEFPGRKKPAAGDKPSGKDFMAETKKAHETLFARFVERVEAGQFEDFGSFYGALQEASWQLLEERCKKSFRNGKLYAGSSR